MAQQDVELAIFRVLGAAGVALPGDQVTALADTVFEAAMVIARSEVSQAVAGEIVADRARERAAAAEAIKLAQSDASEAIQVARAEAARELEVARAEAARELEVARAEAARELEVAKVELEGTALIDKTLIRRLNAADTKVMRRDATIRELRRELRKATEQAPG